MRRHILILAIIFPLCFSGCLMVAGALGQAISKNRSSSRSSLATTTTTATITDSRIDGSFNGWSGNTVFVLENGQIWQQAQYAYRYHYAYRPRVLIVTDIGRSYMAVDGIEDAIEVRRIK